MADEATSTRRHGQRNPLGPRRLIGRESELAEVAKSIALAPVTTLTGPGGVGNTGA